MGFERAKEAERELKKEQKRAERAEKEAAQCSQLLKEARAEVEALREKNDDLVKRSEEVELGLSNQLTAAEAKAAAEYDRAVLEVTEHYKAQMPVVQDTIWGAACKRCLTKLGVDPSSPFWTDMELPSAMAAVQDNLDAQAQPNLEAQPQTQTQTDEIITDLTISGSGAAEGSAGGTDADPNAATAANERSEEA